MMMEIVIPKYSIAKLCLITLFFLSSCTTPGQSLSTEPAATTNPSSPVAQSGNTPTVRYTITSSPIPATPTPSPTPITSEPAPSQTPLPTLNATQRVETFRELLETNVGCRLPCWWGIIPGQSTWDEIQDQLSHLGWQDVARPLDSGATMHDTHVSGGFDIKVEDFYHTGQSGEIFNTISFIERTSMIERIHIESLGYLNPPVFNALWRGYMPREILRTYGEPDRVWLYTSPILIGDRHGYDLWLIYDQLGFILKYVGLLQISGESFRICISNSGEQITTLKLHLQSPEDATPLELMGNLTGFEDRGILSIEAATKLTKKEFYEMLTQSDESVCFDTPMSVWK